MLSPSARVLVTARQLLKVVHVKPDASAPPISCMHHLEATEIRRCAGRRIASTVIHRSWCASMQPHQPLLESCPHSPGLAEIVDSSSLLGSFSSEQKGKSSETLIRVVEPTFWPQHS